MEKKTVRIDYQDVDLETALRVVRGVVQKGKISGDKIKHYCWAVRYNTGEVVSTRKKKTNKSADSFVVYKP